MLVLGVLTYQRGEYTVVAIGALGDQVVLESSQAQDASTEQAGLWYPDEQDRGARYRWSRQTGRLELRDLGGGSGTVTLSVAGWPVSNEDVVQPTVTVLHDALEVGSFTPTAEYQDYTLALPAATSAHRKLELRSSAVLRATAANTDPRPKGIRLQRLELVTRSGFGLPVGWNTVMALAAATLFGSVAIARRGGRRMLTLLGGSALAMLGAALLLVTRMWMAALAPILALLALVVLFLLEWQALRRVASAVWHRWHWSAALDTGLLGALLVVASGLLVWIPRYLILPWVTSQDTNGLRLAILALLALGSLGLVLAGPTLLPRWLSSLRQRLITGRLSMILLGGFLILWLGWEWSVLRAIPIVGHADYADNAVVARNLVRGRGWVVDYVTQFYALRPDGSVTQPQPTWPLLQPVWIAPFMALFGPTALAARLPNLLFNLALALLIFRIGADGWDRRVGLLAAILTLLNHFFFRLTLFATTDLAFVVWSMAALWLFFRANEGTKNQGPGTRNQESGTRNEQLIHNSKFIIHNSVSRWALAGLMTGLMILQKPSGAVLGAGMVAWVLARWWRGKGLPWRGLLAWAVVSALVISPYVVRNLLVFGKPVASTESIDAWLLFYEGPTRDAWNKIYNVYHGGDVPDHTWILRWGWDRTGSKIAGQWQAAAKFLLPPHGVLLGLPLTCLALLGVTTLRPRQRSLLLLVGAAAGGYLVFLTLYWHLEGEERYLLPFVPWLLLLAVGAVCAIYDRLRGLNNGRWSGLAGLVLSLTLIVAVTPQWRDIQKRVSGESAEYPKWQASLTAFRWLREYTPAEAVVMSRVPWNLTWDADRPSVMIPNEPLPTILGVARYYRAQYLVLNTTANPGEEATAALRPLIDAPADLAIGQQVNGFSLVHRVPSSIPGARPVLIYRFPPDYAGAGAIKP